MEKEDKIINEISKEVEELVAQDTQDLLNLEVDIERGYTEVKAGKEMIRVYHPTQADYEEADRIYLQEYSRLLRDGNYMLYRELREVFEKRGVWKKEYDTRIEELRDLIQSAYITLQNLLRDIQDDIKLYDDGKLNRARKKKLAKSIEEKRKQVLVIQKDIMQYTAELIDLETQRQSIFVNSIEGIASYRKKLFLVYKLAAKPGVEERVPLFNSMDELQKQPVQKVLQYMDAVQNVLDRFNELNLEE